MENASKALLMAAEVLIAMMIVSLGVYVFYTYSQTSREIHDKKAEQQLVEFNAKYTKYVDQTTLTIYDVRTIANYAKKDNENLEDNEKIEVIFNGSNVVNKMIGMVPGAGSVVQSVTGTVLGSSLIIKNALGGTGIIFLLLFLLLPVVKLLFYVFVYFLLSILLEPITDERFILCISAVVKCGSLMIKALCMSSTLFIVIIALTSLTTNHFG